jgi:hypothetical protein
MGHKCLTCPQYGRTGDDCKTTSHSELQCFECCKVETELDENFNYKCKFTGKQMEMRKSIKYRVMDQRQYIPLKTINSGNVSRIEKAKRQADSKTAILARSAEKRKQKADEMPEEEREEMLTKKRKDQATRDAVKKAASRAASEAESKATVLLPPSEKTKDARGNLLKHIKTPNDELALIQEFDTIVDGLIPGKHGVYIGDATIDKDGRPIKNEFFAWLCRNDRQNVLLDANTRKADNSCPKRS